MTRMTREGFFTENEYKSYLLGLHDGLFEAHELIKKGTIDNRREEKMRDIKNDTSRDMDVDEYRAILDCIVILEKAFKKKIRSANIRPNTAEATDVYGVAFAFELRDIVNFGNTRAKDEWHK